MMKKYWNTLLLVTGAVLLPSCDSSTAPSGKYLQSASSPNIPANLTGHTINITDAGSPAYNLTFNGTSATVLDYEMNESYNTVAAFTDIDNNDGSRTINVRLLDPTLEVNNTLDYADIFNNAAASTPSFQAAISTGISAPTQDNSSVIASEANAAIAEYPVGRDRDGINFYAVRNIVFKFFNDGSVSIIKSGPGFGLNETNDGLTSFDSDVSVTKAMLYTVQ